MEDDPLRCDGCSRESWPDGSIVLHVREDERVSTVNHVRLTCGPTCAGSGPSDVELGGQTVVFRLETIDDVFDYADRMIAAHDWERGTVQRLSRVLAALHRRRVR
jgi:hypothetical protein